ncbi:MAG: acetyl-CoA C-acyltransferase [Chloroflexi bacterium]|nr:acetyl-CoA C-acyltransferase [Chloroflexota bacterium]
MASLSRQGEAQGLPEAVIVGAVRTPVGRYGGALKDVRPDDLAALVIRELVARSHIDPSLIDDVIFGCTNQAGEDNRNVARMALLLAGLPEAIPGQTVNRLCASGLQAVNTAALAIRAGQGEVFIAGGVESMSRAPLVMAKPTTAFPRGKIELEDSTIGWRFVNARMAERYEPISLGETAENVAEKYGISRQRQDGFALWSQEKASAAMKAARFDPELVAVPVSSKIGQPSGVFQADEHPRPEITLEALAALPAAFREGGTVTAGNSSGLNDGAAALLLMSEQRALDLHMVPLARYVDSVAMGVNPLFMGIGPVPATERLLARTGLHIGDVGLVELNEAFAAQALACIDQLGIRDDRLNVNGGAIALGHPLGCTGAKLATSLVFEMGRRAARLGMVSMCVGVGQGVSTLFALG